MEQNQRLLEYCDIEYGKNVTLWSICVTRWCARRDYRRTEE